MPAREWLHRANSSTTTRVEHTWRPAPPYSVGTVNRQSPRSARRVIRARGVAWVSSHASTCSIEIDSRRNSRTVARNSDAGNTGSIVLVPSLLSRADCYQIATSTLHRVDGTEHARTTALRPAAIYHPWLRLERTRSELRWTSRTVSTKQSFVTKRARGCPSISSGTSWP